MTKRFLKHYFNANFMDWRIVKIVEKNSRRNCNGYFQGNYHKTDWIFKKSNILLNSQQV